MKDLSTKFPAHLWWRKPESDRTGFWWPQRTCRGLSSASTADRRRTSLDGAFLRTVANFGRKFKLIEINYRTSCRHVAIACRAQHHKYSYTFLDSMRMHSLVSFVSRLKYGGGCRYVESHVVHTLHSTHYLVYSYGVSIRTEGESISTESYLCLLALRVAD